MADTIQNLFQTRFRKLAGVLYKNYRSKLDSKVTILDLSFDSLKANITGEESEQDFKKLHTVLRKVVREGVPSSRIFSSIDEPAAIRYMSNNTWTYFLVDGGGFNKFFLVSNNLTSGTLRSWFTEKVSRDPRLIDSMFGETTDGSGKRRTNVDFGHTAAVDSPNLTSPLEQKLLATLQFAFATDNVGLVDIVESKLQDLYDVQVGYNYRFSNVSQKDIQVAHRVLAQGYVVITLHSASLNSGFAKLEANIERELVSEIATLVKQTVPATGSPSIVDDIGSNIADIIQYGKVVKKFNHKEKTGSDSTKWNSKVAVSGMSIQLNKAKANSGKSISLARLQVLINNSLGEQVADNMGTGDRYDILNFRSGRFASTVEVDRLAISREGMITAFYRYMKYPYATFEPGGRQGLPKTRDPKLLIAKSIREIAAKIVSNRMRSVSI